MKDYYQLLGVAPTASSDDIKRAFRGQIARYHPDKVQHLGQEFQTMAAGRAAELTEAYRALSDTGRRAEYHRARLDGAEALDAGPRPNATPQAPNPAAAAGAPRAEAPADDSQTQAPRPSQFSQERASRDAFVRRALVGKLRAVLAGVFGSFEEPLVRGFDVVAVPKNKLFARRKHPRLLARFVPSVDKDAIAETWSWAGRWTVPEGEEVCVILMGSAIAPARELADAIAQQRRQPQRSARVTLIPVDARDWHAHIPTDAPPVAKELLDRLRKGE